MMAEGFIRTLWHYAMLPCQGTEGWRGAREQESLTGCYCLKPHIKLTLSFLFGVQVFLSPLIAFFFLLYFMTVNTTVETFRSAKV